jgi:FOG: Ankyrin repeat
LVCLIDNIEIVKLLLPICTKETINIVYNYYNNFTPLYCACQNNNLEMVKLLLEFGAKESVNKADNFYGHTPLYWACQYNNLEVVKLLLEYGANIDQKSLEKVAEYWLEPEKRELAVKIIIVLNITQKFDILCKITSNENMWLDNLKGQASTGEFVEFAKDLKKSERVVKQSVFDKDTFGKIQKEDRYNNLHDCRINCLS